ncbi:hypothetical protein ES702_05198 [subsurface metagenome]
MLGREEGSAVSMIDVAAVEAMELEDGVEALTVLSSEEGAVCAIELGLLECRLVASLFCRLPFGAEELFEEGKPRPATDSLSCISMSRLSSSLSWPPISDAGLLTAGEDDRRDLVLKSSLSGEEDLLPV